MDGSASSQRSAVQLRRQRWAARRLHRMHMSRCRSARRRGFPAGFSSAKIRDWTKAIDAESFPSRFDPATEGYVDQLLLRASHMITGVGKIERLLGSVWKLRLVGILVVFALGVLASVVTFSVADIGANSELEAREAASIATAAPIPKLAIPESGQVDSWVRALAENQGARDAVLESAGPGSTDHDNALAALDPVAAGDFRDELRSMLHRRDLDGVWYASHPASMEAALSRCAHLAFINAECHSAYVAALAHDKLPKGFDPYQLPWAANVWSSIVDRFTWFR